MENYLVTDRSRISSSIEAQQYDYDDIMLITSNTSRSNNVHNTSRIVLESLNDDTFTKTEESNHHPAHVKTPLDKNIEHLNQAYHTIKKEIKDKNVKSEWENFMNNFNGIFEKLKLENIELKTKLSQAPESSRRQVEIQGRDSIEQDEFQNLNSSRRLYEKFAQEEKFFKEKEQLTAENAQLKKELADQKTQIDLMNQNFDESLSQQVNTKVQRFQIQMEPKIIAKVKGELQDQYESLFRERVIEFKVEHSKKLKIEKMNFKATSQGQIHPEFLEQLQNKITQRCETQFKEELKYEYTQKMNELKQSLASAVEDNANKYQSKLKKMLDLCNSKLVDQKTKYETKIHKMREKQEIEKDQLTRREGRNILINQYEEVLQEKKRIINQFQADQDSVMKKLDILKIQMHQSNHNHSNSQSQNNFKKSTSTSESVNQQPDVVFDTFDNFGKMNFNPMINSELTSSQTTNEHKISKKHPSASSSEFSLHSNHNLLQKSQFTHQQQSQA